MTAARFPLEPMLPRPTNRNYVSSRPKLDVVKDEGDSEQTQGDFMAQARHSCAVCGFRSITDVHALCEARQRNGTR